jgi:hypothetical protein
MQTLKNLLGNKNKKKSVKGKKATVFILSYKANKEMALETEKAFKKKGYKTKIVYGYDLSSDEAKQKKVTATSVVYLNFRDFIFPLAKKLGTHYFVAEDDCKVYDKYTKYIDEYSQYDVVRVGYHKIHKIKGNISYISGGQLTFFNKESNEKMEELFEKTRPQHYDRFLTNLQLKNTLNVLLPKKSRAGFKSHFSRIIDNKRMSYSASISSNLSGKV